MARADARDGIRNDDVKPVEIIPMRDGVKFCTSSPRARDAPIVLTRTP